LCEECLRSVGAVDEVLGERLERCGGCAEGLERGERVGDELRGIMARLLNSVDGRPCRLHAGGVLACGLAQFPGGLCHVEHVIDDLKCQAGLFAELADAHKLIGVDRTKRRSVERAGDDAGGDERAGLGAVNRLDEVGGGGNAFGLDVHHLAADHAGREGGVDAVGATYAGADGGGDLAQDGDGNVRRGLERTDGLEGEGLQRVTGEHGDGFAEDDVAGRLAAAQVIVVERRQVVVDQRISVQHLDGGGEFFYASGRSAAGNHARCLHAKDWPQALAAGKDAVAHGAVNGVGRGIGRGQKPFQCSVGERDAVGEQRSYRGIHQPSMINEHAGPSMDAVVHAMLVEAIANGRGDMAAEITGFIAGFENFRAKYFAGEGGLFARLRQGQSPSALVISCCDSRADPGMLLGAGPGDIFVVRNVANLVPPYSDGAQMPGIRADIEFAVKSLEVAHIIILGHSGCGGIRALMDGEGITQRNYEFIGTWVGIARPVRERVLRELAERPEAEQVRACEQGGIAQTLENLMTFPWIRERVESGAMGLHGWYFDIDAGDLLGYSAETESFAPLAPAAGAGQVVREAAAKS